MKIKSLLIAANWKMNPLTLKEAERIVRSLEQGVNAMKKKDFNDKIDLVICPPMAYLNGLPQSRLWELGAQNVHWEMRGAFTGETAIRMVEDAGCKYVILGHSERRKYFGETDEIVNLKLRSIVKTSIKPIICVGETKEQRDKNQTTKVIRNQLESIFQNVSVLALPKIVVAYEPVWAISTMGNGTAAGEADDPNDVMGIIILIRKVLAEMYRSDVAEKVRIIYGGSVGLRNIDSFLDVEIIEGFLVGGASLSMFDFLPILRKAYDSRK
jgi:triosephosphate isomerase (TIM)